MQRERKRERERGRKIVRRKSEVTEDVNGKMREKGKWKRQRVKERWQEGM